MLNMMRFMTSWSRMWLQLPTENQWKIQLIRDLMWEKQITSWNISTAAMCRVIVFCRSYFDVAHSFTNICFITEAIDFVYNMRWMDLPTHNSDPARHLKQHKPYEFSFLLLVPMNSGSCYLFLWIQLESHLLTILEWLSIQQKTHRLTNRSIVTLQTYCQREKLEQQFEYAWREQLSTSLMTTVLSKRLDFNDFNIFIKLLTLYSNFTNFNDY